MSSYLPAKTILFRIAHNMVECEIAWREEARQEEQERWYV